MEAAGPGSLADQLTMVKESVQDPLAGVRLAIFSPPLMERTSLFVITDQISSRTWTRVAVLVGVGTECHVPGYLSKLSSVLAPEAYKVDDNS